MKRIHLDTTSSTNDYLRAFIPARENVIVTARHQTGGKGTKGRSFLSEAGGVYLSALTFYEDFPASRAFEIMAHAAVAVCRTAEAFGCSPRIKWANDVLIGNKKICGILIENGLSGDRVDHSIVGIGVNVTNDVSALGGIATSISAETERAVTADEVRERLIEEYLRPSTFEEYLARAAFLGERVHIVEGEREYEGIALGILPDGRLKIEDNGRIRSLSTAEIRIAL